MAFRPGKGIGEGAAWAVGPATNAFSGADKAAAKTSLDNYTADANNATWLAVYDARPAFMVRLVWPTQTPTDEAFFARVNSTWVEVTPVLRGQRGIQGQQGAGVPPVSGDDNGSVLRVVAGAWAKVSNFPASIIGSGTFAAARIPTITLGKLSAAVRARLLPTGASTGQVARWDGDAWVPGNAGGAGGSPAVESPSAEAKAGTDSAAANATRMTPRRTAQAIEAQAVVPADFTPKESDLWFLWASSHNAWASATNAKGSITYYTGPPNASTFVPDLAQADRAVDASTITHIRMSKFAFPDTNYLLTPTADVPRPSGTLYQHPDQPYYGNILGTFVVGNVTEGGSGDAAYWEFTVIGTGGGFWAGPNTFIRNTDEIPGTVTVPGSQVQLNDAFLSRLRTLNTFAATLATSLTGFLGIASTGRTSLITALGAFLVKRTDLTGLSGDTFSTWATTADFLAASDKRGLWSIATNDGGAPGASDSQTLSAVSSGNATFLYGAPRTDVDGLDPIYGAEPQLNDHENGDVIYEGPWLPYKAGFHIQITRKPGGAKLGSGSNGAYVYFPVAITVTGTAPANAAYFRRSAEKPSGLAGRLPWPWIVAPPWVKQADLETKESDFWGVYESGVLGTDITDRRGSWALASTGTGAPASADVYGNAPSIQAGTRTLIVGGSMYPTALSTNPDVVNTPDKAIAANALLGVSHIHLSTPHDKDNYIKFTPTGAATAVGSGNSAYSYVHGTVEIVGTLVGGTGWMFMDRPPPDLELDIPWEWISRPPGCSAPRSPIMSPSSRSKGTRTTGTRPTWIPSSMRAPRTAAGSWRSTRRTAARRPFPRTPMTGPTSPKATAPSHLGGCARIRTRTSTRSRGTTRSTPPTTHRAPCGISACRRSRACISRSHGAATARWLAPGMPPTYGRP